jgi:broad-specificity NMP kinase
MARIILIFGNPGNGKTTLANRLRAEHGFEVMSVDCLYVEFIKSHYSMLYFDDLSLYIDNHYNEVLKSHDERVRNWHEHLFKNIVALSRRCDRLVVEGYLLFDCKDDYENRLTERSIRVVQVHAEGHSYSTRSLSVEQIAWLGTQG